MDKEELIRLLMAWQKNQISIREVHEQAELLWESRDWPKYSREDSRSIFIEVLSQLSILNQQLIIQSDIPEIIDFLNTPDNASAKGWEKWKSYWKNIDFEDRKRQLKNTGYYCA